MTNLYNLSKYIPTSSDIDMFISLFVDISKSSNLMDLTLIFHERETIHDRNRWLDSISRGGNPTRKKFIARQTSVCIGSNKSRTAIVRTFKNDLMRGGSPFVRRWWDAGVVPLEATCCTSVTHDALISNCVKTYRCVCRI